MDYLQDILNGSKLAAGRLIKLIEDNEPIGFEILTKLYPHAGHAFIIGITGPPGAGKSTLIDQIVAAFRQEDKTVAVLAFDPTSPISGGAILGDRIRMRRHSLDAGVFMRSIATRGALGGISVAAKGAAIVLDAMGYDIILVETAGVGQIGADISLLVHMILVLCIPGMGDGLQALKAGTLELADLFIVNKSDTPGADDVVVQLETMLHFQGNDNTTPRAGIVKASATQNTGVTEIIQAIKTYQLEIQADKLFIEKSAKQEYRHLKAIIKDLAAEKFWRHIQKTKNFETILDDVKNRRTDPYSAAHTIIKNLFKL